MRFLKFYIISLFVLLSSAGFVESAYAQNETRIMGCVKSSALGDPISGVVISVDDIIKGYTDDGGNFSLVLPRNSVMIFNHKDYDSKSIVMDGKQELDIRLNERSIQLEEIIVSYESRHLRLSVEPTEIEVKGDYLHMTTKYYVPDKMFKTDFRFVAQPVIEDRTLGITRELRPVVIDGKKYDQKQYQWLGYGDQEDVLEPYIVANEIDSENNIYSYRDSLYVGETDPDFLNEYYSHCFLALVSYREPPHFLDTVTIANGIVNPIRHFEYDIPPMQLDGSLLEADQEPYIIPTGADTMYIPAYELKLQQVSGVAKIAFAVNSSKINYSDSQTKSKIEEIQSFIDVLQKNPDANIKSISLCGYSSPEGVYSKNLKLAHQRTEELQRAVLYTISPTLRDYIELNIDSAVEPWSRVADLAEGEYPELAAKVRDIVTAAKGSYDKAGKAVARLPEYRSVIVPKYLDQLRTVTYNIDYSIYMPLPYAAIKTKYDNGEELSRYEFYTMISNEPNKELIPQMEADAIAAYPNFMIVANRLAVNNVLNDSVDLELLKPLLDKNAPTSITYNQAVMAILSDEFELADSLVFSIRDIPEAEYLKVVSDVLNGYVEDAYYYYEDEMSLNKVLLLLAMKRDKEAFALMSRIMEYPTNQEKANHCYVYAMCANRIDNLTIAMVFLEQAIILDSTYDSIVRRDADLLDIYELIRPDK